MVYNNNLIGNCFAQGSTMRVIKLYEINNGNNIL